MLDFDRLRVLATLARTGSMRAAAMALHVTPGAVSRAMARLEEEAGIDLVRPEGRGVQLTPAGAWLARRADFLVGEHAALDRDLSARRFRATDTCVATYDAFAAWLPALLARQYLPGVCLSLRERWPGEVERAVAETVSDVGVTYAPVPTDGVEHRQVARVELGIYVCSAELARTPVSALPWALPSHPITGATLQHGALDGWPSDAPPRDVIYHASALEARLELCRDGLAAVLLPTFVAERCNRSPSGDRHLTRVQVGAGELPRMDRRVYVVTRTSESSEPGSRASSIAAAVAAMCAAG